MEGKAETYIHIETTARGEVEEREIDDKNNER